MSQNDSWLYGLVEKTRNLLDDPGGKYNNGYLLRQILGPSTSDVYSYLNSVSTEPITLRFPVTLVDGQEEYQLPRAQRYIRFTKFDDELRVKDDFYPRSEFHPFGPGWEIQDATLMVRPLPDEDDDEWRLTYVPASDGRFHYATDGRLDNDLQVLTLSESPALGDLERLEGALVGHKVRLIPTTGTVEERLIVAHDAEERTVTLRRPFTHAGGAINSSSSSSSNQESLTYEIIPRWSTGAMAWATAAQAALYLAPGMGISQSRQQGIILAYRRAIKTLGDEISNKNARTGKSIQRVTTDAEEFNSPDYGYAL